LSLYDLGRQELGGNGKSIKGSGFVDRRVIRKIKVTLRVPRSTDQKIRTGEVRERQRGGELWIGIKEKGRGPSGTKDLAYRKAFSCLWEA